ncbi:MAG: protein-L-isoaspartate O-methyltransferase, partial [Candidatus Dadabacteria bacterium]
MANTSLKAPPCNLKWQHFAEKVLEEVGLREEDELYKDFLDALSSVPRSEFVDKALSLRASEDVSLPIGFGQTISKPSTVVTMLVLAGKLKGKKVLEVGCGSGYCSALMSVLGAEVYAVEYNSYLAQRARERLDKLGFYNIILRCGNGLRGWSEHSPYDVIIVSAAFKEIPKALYNQLKPQGGTII